MTCVIVSDASCLIDLRKGALLAVLCDLPYRFVVPLPVRKSEVIDFSKRQWRQLDDAGMITYDLTPDEVALALALKARHPALSVNDCFCFVTALAHPGTPLSSMTFSTFSTFSWAFHSGVAAGRFSRSLSAIRNLEKSEAERPIAISG